MKNVSRIIYWVRRVRTASILLMTTGLVRLYSIGQFFHESYIQMGFSGPTPEECEGTSVTQFDDVMDFARYVLAHSEDRIFERIDQSFLNWDTSFMFALVGGILMLLTSYMILILQIRMESKRVSSN